MKRGIAGILAFFSLWALLTSVLAWPVALVVEAAAPGVFPFSRVFGRVELGVALALAAGLLRFWGEDPRPWVDGRGWRKELGRAAVWAGLGLGMVGLVAVGQVGLGVRSWGGWPGVGEVLGAVAVGVGVGSLEEFFFRGVLGLAWWRAMGNRRLGSLIFIGALIFGAAHFIRPQPGPGLEAGWLAGFQAWGRLELWAGTGHLWKLAGLILSGLILGRVVLNQGTLAGAIGLHAGWVAGLRWAESAWPVVPQAVGGWWGPSLEEGPLPFLLLLAVALFLWGRPIRANLD